MAVRAVVGLVAVLIGTPAVRAADPPPGAETGTVTLAPGDQSGIDDRYRLSPGTFPYTLTPRYDLPAAGIRVYDLTFPSPVSSGDPVNDLVHAEYFLPAGAAAGARVPGVVVLDILDGAAVVSRGEAVWLAQHGVGSLFMYMAHYGPRKSPGARRLLSPDLDRTMSGLRQTVLDARCATAWLAARAEIDPANLGLVGTSLGSLVGGVTAANEPRLTNVCLLLTGGGLVDALWDHPKARPFHPVIDLAAGGKDGLRRFLAPVDPLTHAARLRGRNVLMICASRDDVIPPDAARALAAASGADLRWVDATHVGAGLYVFPIMRQVVQHVGGK